MSSPRAAGQADLERAPPRPIALARPDIAYELAADGSRRLRSRTPLGRYDPSLANLFRAAVARNP
ncbi:MAG TPA: hypothetical protein VGF60_23150, partial [Xanthobacteraceae bacterium]